MAIPYNKMTPEQKKQANINTKNWKQKNRDKVLLYKRKHYYDNHEKYLAIERARSYKKLYGITVDDYDRMFLEQKGVCKICGIDRPTQNINIKRVYFSVDHCHTTGKVRGLLCSRCNSQLGWYENYRDQIKNYLN